MSDISETRANAKKRAAKALINAAGPAFDFILAIGAMIEADEGESHAEDTADLQPTAPARSSELPGTYQFRDHISYAVGDPYSIFDGIPHTILPNGGVLMSQDAIEEAYRRRRNAAGHTHESEPEPEPEQWAVARQPIDPYDWRRQFDQSWQYWKPGDKIIWEINKWGPMYPITGIDPHLGYVFWNDPAGGPENWSHWTNLLRVTWRELPSSSQGEGWHWSPASPIKPDDGVYYAENLVVRSCGHTEKVYVLPADSDEPKMKEAQFRRIVDQLQGACKLPCCECAGVKKEPTE